MSCHVMSAGQIFNNFCYYIHTYIILLLLQFITKNGVILIINLLINYFNLLYKKYHITIRKIKGAPRDIATHAIRMP